MVISAIASALPYIASALPYIKSVSPFVASGLPMLAGQYETNRGLTRDRSRARRQSADIAWSKGIPKYADRLYNDYLEQTPSDLEAGATNFASAIPSMFNTYDSVSRMFKPKGAWEQNTDNLWDVLQDPKKIGASIGKAMNAPFGFGSKIGKSVGSK